MRKRTNDTTAGYSDQFKPAIQLRAPTLDQWADFFYASQLQEQFDENGGHFLRLGRTQSNDPEMGRIIQLTTPVKGFTPNFREVEIIGKKDYTALCVEGGPNQIGVCLYLIQTVDVGAGVSETHINLRYLPFAMLTDLVVATTKAGLLELKLPGTDIAKLNVTLRASPLLEPEYRTFKTEMLFENLPTPTRQRIENRLNFESASIAAFTGYQILSAQGQWPPAATTAAAPGSLQAGEWQSTAKKVTVAVLVTVGSVVGLIGEAVEDHTTIVVGLGIGGAGVIANYWLNVWVADFPPDAPQEQQV